MAICGEAYVDGGAYPTRRELTLVQFVVPQLGASGTCPASAAHLPIQN